MKIVPYLRREMLRTLAGLKTGYLTNAPAETLAGFGLATREAFIDERASLG
jgi:hypothetical protein